MLVAFGDFDFNFLVEVHDNFGHFEAVLRLLFVNVLYVFAPSTNCICSRRLESQRRPSVVGCRLISDLNVVSGNSSGKREAISNRGRNWEKPEKWPISKYFMEIVSLPETPTIFVRTGSVAGSSKLFQGRP